MSHTMTIGSTAAAAVLLAFALPTAASAAGPQACVSGHVHECFGSLAQAVAATRNGDVVTLSSSIYAGGVTIATSIQIIGAGETATVVEGGGPVLTLTSTDDFSPSVQISGLTVTGGVNHGTDMGGQEIGYNADGGGILVPFPPSGNAGASLTLSHVTVAGNETAPSSTDPSPSGASCPGRVCPYAGTSGAGIATAGPLTLDHVTVAHNLSGGVASDASGGGIFSAVGPVQISFSQISGNTAAPTPHTIGRFAEGGAITVGGGSQPTTITRSSISGNDANLVTDWPVTTDGQPVNDDESNLVNMAAQAGGVFMEGNTQLTLTDSAVTGNAVTADDPAGEPLVYAAALHYQFGGEGLLMTDTTIADNHLAGTVATTDQYVPMGGIFESDGHAMVKGVAIVGNTQNLRTTQGTATLNGPVFLCGCENGDGGVVDLTHVAVSDNITRATSDVGPARVWGGGIFAVDGTHLTLSASTVSRNLSIAVALSDPSGSEVRGGGLWVAAAGGSNPVVDLTGSAVTYNGGIVSKGGTVYGGGLYAEVPVAGTSGVAHNVPNNVDAP